MVKICSKCLFPKDDEFFSKDGHGGRKAQCKDCDKQYRLDHKAEQQAYDKQYYQKNKKPIYEANKPLFKKKNAKYYQENKEEIKDRVREYVVENADKVKEVRKQYYEENKEVILEKQGIYYKTNFDRIRLVKEAYRITHKEERNKNHKIRYDTEPAYKLRMNLSTAIFGFLKKIGSSKNNISIMKYIPYSIEDLKIHIEKQFESWMTWDNHGRYDRESWDNNDSNTWTWQIDHIIPQSLLPYTSMEDKNFQKCWALENLRPLSAKQNLIDGNRRK
jgi:hypothetical protein